MGYREDGKWWVSPANYEEEVRNTFNFPDKLEILDTTLRDGEQQAGIIFTREDKVAIAKKLAAVGVHRIEAGTPAASQEDADAIKAIVDEGLDSRIFCFCRNMVKDMELAKSLGADGVVAEIIGSEHLLKYGKRWTLQQAVDACVEATQAAHELGLYVTFFPADGSRADMNFLMDMVQAVAEGGHIDSFALVDTFGTFSPEGAAFTVRKFRERFDFPIEAHFHSDFDLGGGNNRGCHESWSPGRSRYGQWHRREGRKRTPGCCSPFPGSPLRTEYRNKTGNAEGTFRPCGRKIQFSGMAYQGS